MSAISGDHRFGPKAREVAKEVKQYAAVFGIIALFFFILSVNGKDLQFMKYSGLGVAATTVVGTLAHKVESAKKRAIPVEKITHEL